MKKILVLISVLVLLLSIEVFAITVNFTDVNSDDWYYNNLSDIADKNIIVGYPDGTFKPNSNLKFEEFIKMIVVAIDENNIGQAQGQEWYQVYVDKALENKYITEQQKAFIGQNIDRKTMAEIIFNVLSSKEDVKKYSEEEFKYIITLLKDIAIEDNKTLTIAGQGIICGYPDGTFKPGNNLTRSETVAVINRLINKEQRLQIEIKLDQIIPIPNGNVSIEDLPNVDLSYLYNYPTMTGNSIKEDNVYYKTNGTKEGYYVDFVPNDYINFMKLMHNRDYETINNNSQNYKNNINYYLNGRKEYKGIEYKELRSYHLSYNNSPEMIDYINNKKDFIEDFLNIWVGETINNKVKVQSKFYTNGSLMHTAPDGTTVIRGVLRIKYDKHDNPNNIKEELDLIKRNKQNDYNIYMKFNDIPNIEVGKWYDIAMDIVVMDSSMTHGLNNISWYNYRFTYPISINEVK